MPSNPERIKEVREQLIACRTDHEARSLGEELRRLLHKQSEDLRGHLSDLPTPNEEIAPAA